MSASSTVTFAQKFGDKYSFDPAQIIAIISSLMAIFESCNQSSEQVRAAVKSPNLMQQARATRIVMNELDNVPRRQAREIAQALLAEAAAEDDATISAVLRECRSNNW